MEAKEKWNLIVKQYKENYYQPESKIQRLWEVYCSEVFGYSKLMGEFDSQINKGIGSRERVVPDIILKKDGKDIFDIELKQYNLYFSSTMEEQIKSYLELFHLSVGMIACQKIFLCSFDYSLNKLDIVAIPFEENNEDGIRLIELLQKENFDEKKIKEFIIHQPRRNSMAQYKKCIKCEINYTTNDDCICDTCKKQTKATQNHNSRNIRPICETFTFTSEKTHHKNAPAYEVYNASNDNVGYVFMTDDKRTPAYGHCEIHFYPSYQNKYQEWRRITSNGQRIKWEEFCKRLIAEGKCKYYID